MVAFLQIFGVFAFAALFAAALLFAGCRGGAPLPLNPAFKKSIFMYTADIVGTALDELTINGTTDSKNFLSYLSMGQTIINPKQGDIFALKVDNSSKTKSSMYIVQLLNSRIDPLPEAKLAGLSLFVGGAVADFNADIHSYTVDLPKTLTGTDLFYNDSLVGW